MVLANNKLKVLKITDTPGLVYEEPRTRAKCASMVADIIGFQAQVLQYSEDELDLITLEDDFSSFEHFKLVDSHVPAPPLEV